MVVWSSYKFISCSYGGLVGSAIVKGGLAAVVPSGIIKILSFIVISPLLGMFLGSTLGVIVYRIFKNSTPRNVDSFFRKGQLMSAAAYSLGHGGNDAQKNHGNNRRTAIQPGTHRPYLSCSFLGNYSVPDGTLRRNINGWMENSKNNGKQNNKT